MRIVRLSLLVFPLTVGCSDPAEDDATRAEQDTHAAAVGEEDALEEDGPDALFPKAGWWNSTDFSFEIDECNLTTINGLRPENTRPFLLSHTADGFNTTRQVGEPASFTPDGTVFIGSVSWLVDCREGCQLFGSPNETILDVVWELKADVTMNLLSSESAEMSEHSFGVCEGTDCASWREGFGISGEPCESAHRYVANWAAPDDDVAPLRTTLGPRAQSMTPMMVEISSPTASLK